MDDRVKEVERLVGHSFGDPELVERALTHSSLADRRALSNERMEFLGDSILGFVVCEHLYRRYPDADEGHLTKIKSYLVSRLKCAEYAHEAGLVGLLSVGKGFSSQRALPQSVAAAVFESIVAALYLDGGLALAQPFIMRFVGPHVESTERMGHQMNFKSVLQQIAQSRGMEVPTYAVTDERGPDHSKEFEVAVAMGRRRFAACWGGSKKVAEQAAALAALKELGHAVGDEPTIEIRWPGDQGAAPDTARSRESAAASTDPADTSTTESARDS